MVEETDTGWRDLFVNQGLDQVEDTDILERYTFEFLGVFDMCPRKCSLPRQPCPTTVGRIIDGGTYHC
jgi:hypothetical protein